MNCFKIITLFVAVSWMSYGPQAAAQESSLQVGLARADITPDYPILLNGFLSRQQASTGVRQKIWAKAMAIKADQNSPLVLITVDTLGIPAAIRAEVCRRLEPLGIDADRVAITATHTHTAPIINGCAPNILARDFTAEEQQRIDQYTADFTNSLFEVAKAALANRRPASMQWATGQIKFATNRRSPDGPVDHDLPVLAIRDAAGKLIGVYCSYACHCVTLSERRIGGDWAGYAQSQIEQANPGCIAMMSVGCAGDQNPDASLPRNLVDSARAQGALIAAEVSRLLQTDMTPIETPLSAKLQPIELPLDELPSKQEFTELAKLDSPTGYHARTQLAKLQRGESLRQSIDYPVQVWAFGESLCMVFLGGEVTVEYGLQLKAVSDGPDMWVNAYANACPCYIPSERVLRQGGYEGAGAMIYYDQPTKLRSGLETQILSTVESLCHTLTDLATSPAASADANLTQAKTPQASMQLLELAADDLAVGLVASEPLIASPVAVDFSPDGKVYVAEMFDYPEGIEGDYQPGGRVRVLRSSRGDGTFDQSEIFLDGIPFPTGVTAWRSGVLVCAAPDILYAEDRDQDGRADIVRKLYSGFGTDNYQARVNSLEYGLDGWVYGSCGLFGGSITSALNGTTLELGNHDFRIRPDTGEIERAVGRTQQGRVRDCVGNWFGCTNGSLAFQYPLQQHYLRRNPSALPGPLSVNTPATAQDAKLIPASDDLQLFKLSGRSGLATAACGIGVYRDGYLGQDYASDIFTCEPVNLLVHHLQLTAHQATMQGRVPAAETKHAFLSSTDPWFRPVQARTAPDGSLWIVDMYRHVIEHPRWIPKETLQRLDVRAGSDHGRIYRVSRTDTPTRPWPRLDQKTPAELVSLLESPNGWQRDMSMQLLQWKPSTEAAAALRTLLRQSAVPTARLAALCTLQNLGHLQTQDAKLALGNESAAVRRQAVRVAEQFATTAADQSDPLFERLATLVDDPDASVRLQVACSLGEWPRDATGNLLADLLLDQHNVPFFESAVVSSLHSDNVDAFANRMLQQMDRSAALAPRLFPVLLAICRPETGSRLVGKVCDVQSDQLQSWQWNALPKVLTMLRSKADVRTEFEKNAGSETITTCLQLARQTSIDEDQSAAVRIAAIRCLNCWQTDSPHDQTALAEVLNARNASDVQLAAVEVLAKSGSQDTAKLLVDRWPQASPPVKAAMLTALTSRKSSVSVLLDAIDQAQIRATEIDPATRQRMLNASDATMQAQVERLLAGTATSDRAAVLAAYADVPTLPADASRGEKLFTKNCVTCHRLNGAGHQVGPDLDPLAVKPVDFFTQEILDPSRNLDSRYSTYTALTDSGRIITGLLAAETDTAITLRLQDAKQETLQRSELEEFRSNPTSLMPTGFEKDLDNQQLADLIEFIRSHAPK
ncbi:neutral/alkaline non-lysosomal ceramidase N-terminal domain-containing protein [Roseimaritima ulvae]|uniref:neutral/alkaline non-lysosomal ceramidase N-terminal domain-containing protein n=1 Tax=Roseimaritima ulvae TaxID=980254 RepID=UPI00138FE07F|nr:neutral/alkaline non-lysosomal ceramidase N-terminal domain-containing protein [Roseimaritima ulvae]